MIALYRALALSVAACLMSTATLAAKTEPVEFEAKETYEGASVIAPGTVTGLLTTPDGSGPFPIVVLLHGCAGPTGTHEEWAQTLASWGYASLRVDSFGPRGISEICTDILRPVPRVADVNGAMEFLHTLDEIDSNNVAIMGFSHGANVTLLVAGEPGSLAQQHKPAVKAAIAFYPYCPTTPQHFGPPLMVLVGDADDWTPVDLCVTLADGSTADGRPIDLVVYEGATHSYDCRSCNGEYWGHKLVHNPAAHADSINRVHDFLLANLGTGLMPPPSTTEGSESSIKLDASNIEEALAGSTTQGVNEYGNSYLVQIFDNGTTTGFAGPDDEYKDTGSWWIEGDMYCRRWSTWLDGKADCFDAVIEGDTIRWLNPDGSLAREESYIAPQ